MPRYAKVVALEDGWHLTEAGRANFFLQMQQVASAFRDTLSAEQYARLDSGNYQFIPQRDAAKKTTFLAIVVDAPERAPRSVL